MFVNVCFHLQFAIIGIVTPNNLQYTGAKIKNKKEITKEFINFFKKIAILLTHFLIFTE